MKKTPETGRQNEKLDHNLLEGSTTGKAGQDPSRRRYRKSEFRVLPPS